MSADSSSEQNFEGYQPRECGEHRTVGPHRAWCFDCNEWCYPGGSDVACKGCRTARLPPGMTSEKLEKIADYVTLLDHMNFDLKRGTVTFGLRKNETEMQDDLRAWAEWLRREVEDGKE